MSQDRKQHINQLVKTIAAIRPDVVDKPTLVYFDIIGIAWTIRCLLHLHNIDYHYLPLTIGDWSYGAEDGSQPLKTAFSNGHVPLYVDKDISLNQSNLILKTVAQRNGMMGESEAEALAIEALLAHCYDAQFHWNGMLGVNIRLNIPDDVANARLESFMGNGVWGVVTNGYRNHLQAFDHYLAANASNSGFMVGNRLSAADLASFNVLCNWYKAFDREVFCAEFPRLEEYIQRIASIDSVGDYIRNVQEATLWFELPQVAMRLTTPQELEGLVRV